MLINNEQIVQKLADSYPFRRAAQFVAYFMQKGHEKIESIKEDDRFNKLKDDVDKAEKNIDERVFKMKSTFFTELKKEWEKEKSRIDAEKNKRDSER